MRAMKITSIVFALAVTTTFARADDITAMISQYRREHGLPAVKTDPQLTAVAERQAKAMAAAGVLDHDVAGPFASRIANTGIDSGAENIAVGSKTWEQTLKMWKESSGHNANLLRRDGELLGVAVAYNNNTRYKAYWAMVIGHKGATTGKHTASGRSEPAYMEAASAAVEPAAPKRRTSADANSPGFLDSIGAALKRVASPIRNLWN
jgi:cysteine-rich secretory family protein